MRPRNPLKLEDCKSREELFDTRIMWFLLEHNEPAKISARTEATSAD